MNNDSEAACVHKPCATMMLSKWKGARGVRQSVTATAECTQTIATVQPHSLVLHLPDLSNRFFHTQAEATDYKCCALKYDYNGELGTPPEGLTAEEFCESSDAEGHWCEYVNWEQYAVCQTGGIVVFIICGVIAVCAVLQVHIISVRPASSVTGLCARQRVTALCTLNSRCALTLAGSAAAGDHGGDSGHHEGVGLLWLRQHALL